jgi:predicted PolB exonuclease-like 3'-5' exonuclease
MWTTANRQGFLDHAMMYAVFDIETRIDKSLVKSVYAPKEDISDREAYERLRAERVAESGSDFLPISFHVPISIAVGIVNNDAVLVNVETLGANDYSEEAIVRDFWDRVERFNGTLVSFNGRNFDLPVLELHALKYRCQAPRYFNQRFGHRYRYSEEGHYDLYDFVGNHGVNRIRGGFDLLCKLIGLRGKGDIDGSMVQGFWEEGRLAEIHEYCRQDVIQTYFLLLRVELMRGRIDERQFEAAWAATERFRDQLEEAGPEPDDAAGLEENS